MFDKNGLIISCLPVQQKYRSSASNCLASETIDVSEWDYANRRFVDTGDIPLFYDMGVVDVDDDGDFDFIPHTINMGHLLSKSTDGGVDSFNWQTNIGKNFHWRNDGGSFTLVNDRTNYKN